MGQINVKDQHGCLLYAAERIILRCRSVQVTERKISMKLFKPIDRHILRIALPSIVSNITVPLLGLVDLAIVGHMGDAAYIGAIAVGSMVFNVVYWIFGFLRMGTSGMTSQALGGGKAASSFACSWYVCRFVLARLSVVALARGVGGHKAIGGGRAVCPYLLLYLRVGVSGDALFVWLDGLVHRDAEHARTHVRLHYAECG